MIPANSPISIQTLGQDDRAMTGLRSIDPDHLSTGRMSRSGPTPRAAGSAPQCSRGVGPRRQEPSWRQGSHLAAWRRSLSPRRSGVRYRGQEEGQRSRTPPLSGGWTLLGCYGPTGSVRATFDSLMNTSIPVLGTVNRHWAEQVLAEHTGQPRTPDRPTMQPPRVGIQGGHLSWSGLIHCRHRATSTCLRTLFRGSTVSFVRGLRLRVRGSAVR